MKQVFKTILVATVIIIFSMVTVAALAFFSKWLYHAIYC